MKLSNLIIGFFFLSISGTTKLMHKCMGGDNCIFESVHQLIKCLCNILSFEIYLQDT